MSFTLLFSPHHIDRVICVYLLTSVWGKRRVFTVASAFSLEQENVPCWDASDGVHSDGERERNWEGKRDIAGKQTYCQRPVPMILVRTFNLSW